MANSPVPPRMAAKSAAPQLGAERIGPAYGIPSPSPETPVPGKIEGKVVAVTESGNLVTDILLDRLSDVPRDDSVTIQCDEHQTVGIFPADHGQPAFTLLAVEGESGALELAIVEDSAKIMLGVGEGTPVEVRWE